MSRETKQFDSKENIMKKYLPAFAALALSFTNVTLVPTLKADELNKETKIVIDQPIQVLHAVLSPGSYVIKRLESPSDNHAVQIFSAHEKRLITTIFTIPVYRNAPADTSEFKFYESVSGQTASLHTWFYPGDTIGFEFPRDRAQPRERSARTNTNTVAVIASTN
jgi:hypothetical protein